MRYLGVYFIRHEILNAHWTMQKDLFYRAANAMFSKVGPVASGEVTLHVIKLKLFNTIDIEIVKKIVKKVCICFSECLRV